MISQKEFLDFAKTLNVLYVEDDKKVHESMLDILRNLFDTITLAIDGMDGLEKLKATSIKFDMILSDINMPRLDGIEMCKMAKKENKDITIVFLTAFTDTDKLLSSIDIGVDGYIVKPLMYKNFISVIKKAVNKIYLQKMHKNYKTLLEERVKIQTHQLLEQTRELEHKYYHDRVTGLRNRQAFLDDTKKNKFLEVMVLDINKFSAINDIYGEHIGNKVLINFANRLKQHKKPICKLYKISADQFLLANSENKNLYSESMAQEIIERSLSTPMIIDTQDTDIEINVNTTIAIVKSVEITKILEYTDMTLKYAKKSFQPLVTYTPSLNIEKNYYKAINAINIIRKAIKADTLVPFFQPILKQDGLSYECLARVIDGENIISPCFFIDDIKHTPYYTIVTKLIIDKCFEYFKDKPNSFSINISFEDISNPYIVKHLKEKLKETNMNNQLILEILESEIIDNFNLVREFITQMKSLGVRIALDDFGSGYSNFIYLLELNPNYLKIDGSLIEDIDTNKKSYTIVKTIISFADELGIKTIAEYIHNESVYKIAKELGIYGFQGYFLGEPKKIIEEIK